MTARTSKLGQGKRFPFQVVQMISALFSRTNYSIARRAVTRLQQSAAGGLLEPFYGFIPGVRPRRMAVRRLCALLILFCLIFVVRFNARAEGAIHYVSPTGSDDSFGTSSQPWRTIQRAVDAVAPGDKVIVKAGIYYERVQINVSGSPGQPITFEGERGPNGEWLTIIDGGDRVSGWVPAPEVGAGVYKTTSIPYEPYAMTVDDRTIWRINTRSMNGILVENARGTGFDALARPAEATVQYSGSPEIKYWDGLDALFGYRDGVTYIRFRAGDDPNAKDIRSSPGPVDEYAAPAGATVLIADTSHVTIRGFWIRAAHNAVLISGPAAQNNIIEGNVLTNGTNRVFLYGGASKNHIRGNEMKMNPYSIFRPGAGDDTYAGWITFHLYFENKFLVGNTSETDHNIRVWNGANDNEIYLNHIYDGIVGIRLMTGTTGTKIYNNEINNHSGQGFELYPSASAQIYDNLVYDNKYNMRIMSLQEYGPRRLDIYRNRFYSPPGLADHIFFNAEWGVKADSYAEIYFYHNSIAGGRNAFLMAGFDPGYGMPYVYILNNIVSSQYAYNTETTLNEEWHLGTFDYNWIGGQFTGHRAWYGRNNISAWGEKQWDDSTIPHFLLQPGSSSRSAGIDLSKPVTIEGRAYTLPAFAGMAAAYFTGPRPDLGAIQSSFTN
jgi:parallel beta-helix repeat protein